MKRMVLSTCLLFVLFGFLLSCSVHKSGNLTDLAVGDKYDDILFDAIFTIAQSLSPELRYDSIYDLSYSYLVLGEYDQVKRLMEKIECEMLISTTIVRLCEVDNFKMAEELVQLIDTPFTKAEALRILSDFFYEANQPGKGYQALNQSEELAPLIEHDSTRAYQYAILSIRFAEHGHRENARHLARIALDQIPEKDPERIPNSDVCIGFLWEKHYAQIRIAEALAEAGDYDQAFKIIPSIVDYENDWQYRALQDIAVRAAKAGEQEQADKAVLQTSDENRYSLYIRLARECLEKNANTDAEYYLSRSAQYARKDFETDCFCHDLSDIAELYYQLGRVDRAKELQQKVISRAFTIESQADRDRALLCIVRHLPKIGMGDMVLETMDFIESEEIKQKALGSIALDHARNGNLENAINILESMKKVPPYLAQRIAVDVDKNAPEDQKVKWLDKTFQFIKDSGSAEVAEIYLMLGEREKALAAVMPIDNNKLGGHKVYILSKIAAAFFRAGENHRAEEVIGMIFDLAGNQDYSIPSEHHFPLVRDSISEESRRYDPFLLSIATAYADGGQLFEAIVITKSIASPKFRMWALAVIDANYRKSGLPLEPRTMKVLDEILADYQ